jgi:UDP-2,4-diacetamido-2,4,6-trideoxy-beta-L-altropyranose hydrolase
MFIVIRADASQEIGSGHIMRCLSLAEALRDLGATVEFIVRNHLGNLNKQIKVKGFKVRLLPSPDATKVQKNLNKYKQLLGVEQSIDASETIQILIDRKPDWLIIDHYALNYKWEEGLRPYAKKIMVIDDLANRRHDCDILLDQNYIQDQTRYNQLLAIGTVKLLGPKYALLKKHFLESRKKYVKDFNTVKRVFVFFGGADSDNFTSIAIKVLSLPKLKHLLVDIVIGSANQYRSELKILIEKHPNISLHIQIDNIAELMVKADIALGAGGITTWERMILGIPSIVITTAKNQVDSTRNLDQKKYIKWLGDSDQVDGHIMYNSLLEFIYNTRQRIEQSRRCQSLVDGRGVWTVSKLLMTGPNPEALSIRKAKISDLLLYFHWANDSIVRENAINQQAITLEEHQIWLEKQLDNPNVILLLIECNFGPIGQVRFDRNGASYIISYSLAKQFRGLGLGVVALTKAINYLQQKHSFTLIGKVRESNIASRKVFERLGFNGEYPSRKRIISYSKLQFISTK